MTNKVAVVTGGAAGIGAAICRFLARDGADIAIWDWNIDAAQGLVDELTALGRKVVLCKVDVSNQGHIEAAVKTVREQLGPIGILVNNAGVNRRKKISRGRNYRRDEWERVFNINMKGLFMCTQAVIGDMIEAKWGRIINIFVLQRAIRRSPYGALRGNQRWRDCVFQITGAGYGAARDHCQQYSAEHRIHRRPAIDGRAPEKSGRA